MGWVGAEGLARVNDKCDSETGKGKAKEGRRKKVGKMKRHLEPPSTGCVLGSTHTAGLHAQLLIVAHI